MPSIKRTSDRFPPGQPWRPRLNWHTPAGMTLKALVRALPAGHRCLINVFGFAPLQMAIDPSLLSADVDTFSDEDLEQIVRRARLEKGRGETYVQVCRELNYRTSPRWKDRAFNLKLRRATLRFPHPIDILIGKLSRLEEKDIEAFRVVIRGTGHPTEPELIEELQQAVDIFRPCFDEERSGDPLANARVLWRTLFERDIDVRKEIIAPALAHIRYGLGEPRKDYLKELRSTRKYGSRKKRSAKP